MRALKVIKLEAGDDFNIIQQEILMMQQCTHPNIIAYFGSYLKYARSLHLSIDLLLSLLGEIDEISFGLLWNFVREDRCKIFITVGF